MSLRSVQLPEILTGKLLLTAMPGVLSPLESIIEEMKASSVAALVCLNGESEIRMRSFEYWQAIEQRTLPFEHEHFPIIDFGVPQDIEAFTRLVQKMADRIREGEVIAVHCAAGIGRTGLTSVSILMALGVSLDDAVAIVSQAGSHAEDPTQIAFLLELAAQFKNVKG